MSSQPPVLQAQPSSIMHPAPEAARTRLLTGSDYLASFPLDTSAMRRDRPAPMNRDSRAAFHALRGAVPK